LVEIVSKIWRSVLSWTRLSSHWIHKYVDTRTVQRRTRKSHHWQHRAVSYASSAFVIHPSVFAKIYL